MKRFTETSKWSDPWFRKLQPEIKLLWQWILDNCDHAGVIDIDIELASFQIGFEYPINTLPDTLSKIGDRLVKLDGGKFFVPKFIQFQYGILSEDCKAHNPVFISIEKHKIKNLMKEGYPKGIDTPLRTPQDIDKDKDNIKKGGAGGKQVPSLEEVKLCCAKSGLPESDAVWFWNKCEANGWTNGGRAIKSWPHTIASWKAGNFMPSQKNNLTIKKSKPFVA